MWSGSACLHPPLLLLHFRIPRLGTLAFGESARAEGQLAGMECSNGPKCLPPFPAAESMLMYLGPFPLLSHPNSEALHVFKAPLPSVFHRRHRLPTSLPSLLSFISLILFAGVKCQSPSLIHSEGAVALPLSHATSDRGTGSAASPTRTGGRLGCGRGRERRRERGGHLNDGGTIGGLGRQRGERERQ